MYRLLVMCAVVTTAHSFHGCHHNKHNWRHGRHGHVEPVENKLQDIERAIVQQDVAFKAHCEKNSANTVREMYGRDNYFLKYNIPESKNSKVTVQIKHKFIHTTVENTANGRTETVFEDVRILPDMVKTEEAVWSKGSGGLVSVIIPYKVPLGEEAVKECSVVNENIINVPAVVMPTIILRNRID